VGSSGRTAGIVALVAALAGGAAVTSSGRGVGFGHPFGGPTGAVPAATALDGLPVRARAATTGFSRSSLAWAWRDTDGNGCDTADDVLRRDLQAAVVAADGCRVLSGTLEDPYSAAVVRYPRDPVRIDHVVPLEEAWATGAQTLSPSRRAALANDPLNLIATTAAMIGRKGSWDATGWLPPRASYRCAYVARQIAVKRDYGLWVTTAERAAMASVLIGCPDQQLPTGAAADGQGGSDATTSPAPGSGGTNGTGGAGGDGSGGQPDPTEVPPEAPPLVPTEIVTAEPPAVASQVPATTARRPGSGMPTEVAPDVGAPRPAPSRYATRRAVVPAPRPVAP